jgi:hypothetical protein
MIFSRMMTLPGLLMGKLSIFVSDRKDFELTTPDTFKIYKHDYNQKDIYTIDIETMDVERITDLPLSDETSPVVSPDGDKILFISDINGINNIYKKDITSGDRTEIIPITNSLKWSLPAYLFLKMERKLRSHRCTSQLLISF